MWRVLVLAKNVMCFILNPNVPRAYLERCNEGKISDIAQLLLLPPCRKVDFGVSAALMPGNKELCLQASISHTVLASCQIIASAIWDHFLDNLSIWTMFLPYCFPQYTDCLAETGLCLTAQKTEKRFFKRPTARVFCKSITGYGMVEGRQGVS